MAISSKTRSCAGVSPRKRSDRGMDNPVVSKAQETRCAAVAVLYRLCVAERFAPRLSARDHRGLERNEHRTVLRPLLVSRNQFIEQCFDRRAVDLKLLVQFEHPGVVLVVVVRQVEHPHRARAVLWQFEVDALLAKLLLEVEACV